METSKNIFLLATNKNKLDFPFIAKNCFTNNYTIVDSTFKDNCELIGQHIYITISEKPKAGEWCIDIDEFNTKPILNTAYKNDICPTHIKQLKIIITTDNELIKQ